MQYLENKTASDVWAAWEEGAHIVVPFYHKDANPNGERTQFGQPLAWLGTNVISREAEKRFPYIVAAFANSDVHYLPSARMFALRYDLGKEDQFTVIRRTSNLRGTFPVIWPTFVIKSVWPSFVDYFTAYFKREPQMEYWDGPAEANIHRPPTPEEAAAAARLVAGKNKKLYWASCETTTNWYQPVVDDDDL